MLDDDLMRIIDDDRGEQNLESFELSKISKNSVSLNKSGSSLDSLIQNFSSVEPPSGQPEQYKSIFAQDPVWRTAPPTVNNITINNYSYPQPSYPQTQSFFPNMQALVTPQILQPAFYEQNSTRSCSSNSNSENSDS
jgi:hypothetical protein